MNQPDPTSDTPNLPSAEFLDDLDHKALVMRTHAVTVAIQLAHLAQAGLDIPPHLRASLDGFTVAQDAYLGLFTTASGKAVA